MSIVSVEIGPVDGHLDVEVERIIARLQHNVDYGAMYMPLDSKTNIRLLFLSYWN